jgi:hypothetical protein
LACRERLTHASNALADAAEAAAALRGFLEAQSAGEDAPRDAQQLRQSATRQKRFADKLMVRARTPVSYAHAIHPVVLTPHSFPACARPKLHADCVHMAPRMLHLLPS